MKTLKIVLGNFLLVNAITFSLGPFVGIISLLERGSFLEGFLIIAICCYVSFILVWLFYIMYKLGKLGVKLAK